MFCERVVMVPQYMAYEDMKKAKYYDMMKDETQEFVSLSNYRTLEDMIARPHVLEPESEP